MTASVDAREQFIMAIIIITIKNQFLFYKSIHISDYVNVTLQSTNTITFQLSFCMA